MSEAFTLQKMQIFLLKIVLLTWTHLALYGNYKKRDLMRSRTTGPIHFTHHCSCSVHEAHISLRIIKLHSHNNNDSLHLEHQHFTYFMLNQFLWGTLTRAFVNHTHKFTKLSIVQTQMKCLLFVLKAYVYVRTHYVFMCSPSYGKMLWLCLTFFDSQTKHF